jgi:hypothetical protein
MATTTITVGEPKVPNGGSGTYYFTAWVGVVAEDCGFDMVQTGLLYSVNNSGVSYNGGCKR